MAEAEGNGSEVQGKVAGNLEIFRRECWSGNAMAISRLGRLLPAMRGGKEASDDFD